MEKIGSMPMLMRKPNAITNNVLHIAEAEVPTARLENLATKTFLIFSNPCLAVQAVFQGEAEGELRNLRVRI